MKRLLLLALCCAAFTADAQLKEVQPASPTSLDTIFLTLWTPSLGHGLISVIRTGSVIEITLDEGSPFTIVGQITVPVGRLPAGIYSVVVRYQFENFVLTQRPFPLVVAEGISVPVLDPRALGMLAAALAAAAVLMLRRI